MSKSKKVLDQWFTGDAYPKADEQGGNDNNSSNDNDIMNNNVINNDNNNHINNHSNNRPANTNGTETKPVAFEKSSAVVVPEGSYFENGRISEKKVIRSYSVKPSLHQKLVDESKAQHVSTSYLLETILTQYFGA